MQNPWRPSAVLFDLDGTLVDSLQLYFECYRRALEPIMGRLLSVEEILAMKPRSEVRLLEACVAEERRAETLEDFYRHYAALHDELYGGLYDGVPEMLATLRAAGLRLGIVTGKSRRAWEITHDPAAFGEWDVVVVDDDVRAPKPDPHGLQIALETLGVRAEDAVYFGDTMGDVLAANAAGMPAGAALWARGDVDRAAFAARAEAQGARCFATPGDVVRALLGEAASSATT